MRQAQTAIGLVGSTMDQTWRSAMKKAPRNIALALVLASKSLIIG
jgi:hypothetical protein